MRQDELYHEYAIIEFTKRNYCNFLDECDIEHELKRVYVKDYEFADYPEWVEQQKRSSKEYKKLKNLEYDIRFNRKKKRCV